jgi:RNA polymerase sigma factor (TIGR02999 family)
MFRYFRVAVLDSMRQDEGQDIVMAGPQRTEVTELLAAWRAGDARAPDALASLVYQELRAMAARRLAGSAQRPLDTTELVHETFARLLEHPLKATDRSHFFRTVALALRQVLVDAIRRSQAERRGGGAMQVTLGAAADVAIAGPETWLQVEAALAELERADPRKCRIVEMSLLMGMTQVDVAEALDISVPTVERDLRFARAWLRERLAA